MSKTHAANGWPLNGTGAEHPVVDAAEYLDAPDEITLEELTPAERAAAVAELDAKREARKALAAADKGS